jgi:hemin uptake protein HemP
MNPTQNPDVAQPEEAFTVTSPDATVSRECYESAELFGDRKEIFIVHNTEIYRLRRTRHDKLILYK